MLNLYDYISDLDWKRIENYIGLYGVKDNYKGNENYLEDWKNSNKKLFHLLGGELIKKIPFELEISEDHFKNEITILLHHVFVEKYNKKMENLCYDSENCWRYREGFNREISSGLDILKFNYFYDDKIVYGLKYKSSEKNTLQLQKGMKPIRALQKILKYFDWYEELKEDFEDFRIAHSMIYNTKILKGNFCISIHPFDFMTMSDNDSSWSSCMSWTHKGCYHIGSVEMMNSNNVICCYLESSKPFNFGKTEEQKGEEWSWNNKKWRQLFYIDKDIIVAGKSYPYKNKNFTLYILEELRKLAKENLNWEFTYGPELYKDMCHIWSLSRMDNNKEWLRNGNSTKHNILFDTKGMYNDMLNDNITSYWCIRNKVKKMKIISYSGKAKCLCCNNNVLEENDDFYYYDEDSYNSRYTGYNRLLCSDCVESRTCSNCGNTGNSIMYKDEETCSYWCQNCYEYYFRTCPKCGDAFTRYKDNIIIARYSDITDFSSSDISDAVVDYDKYHEKSSCKFGTVSFCKKCYEEEIAKEKTIKIRAKKYFGNLYKEYIAYEKLYDKNDPSLSKCYTFNLKHPEYPIKNI